MPSDCGAKRDGLNRGAWYGGGIRSVVIDFPVIIVVQESGWETMDLSLCEGMVH